MSYFLSLFLIISQVYQRIRFESNPEQIAILKKCFIPWNGATMGLPPPFLIVRIRPAILLAGHRSAKIRAAGVIERVGQIIDPLTI